MGASTRDSGSIITCMGMGAMCGGMAEDMKATTSRTKSTVTEFTNGPTVANTRVTGPLENNTAKVSTCSQMARCESVSGSTARGWSGLGRRVKMARGLRKLRRTEMRKKERRKIKTITILCNNRTVVKAREAL